MSFLKKFFVRREIVAPFLHKYDVDIIIQMVRASMHLLNDYGWSAEGPDLRFTGEGASVNQRLLPDHLITDIYSLYYHRSVDQKYAPITKENIHKWKLLMAVNDSSVKIVSNHSAINSALFTVEICKSLVGSMLTELTKEGAANVARSINDTECKEESEGEGETSVSPAYENFCSSLSSTINKAINKAMDKIKEYEDLGINDETAKQFGTDPSSIIGKIEMYKNELQALKINKQAIRRICKNILTKSKGYFSRDYTQKNVPILEADKVKNISGLEYLHPVFKMMELDKITTKKKRYYGKVNVYVDVSGSMSDQITVDGRRIKVIEFARVLLATMLDENLLGDLIPFGSNIKYVKDDPKLIDILVLNANCGTSINNVVKHANSVGENALVITDAQDRISLYDSKLFFVGTPGASFTLTGEGEQFKDNNQLWIFDRAGVDIVPYS